MFACGCTECEKNRLAKMYHFSFAHGEVVAHMFGVSTVSVLVKGFFVLQKPCHQTQRLSWRLRFPEKKLIEFESCFLSTPDSPDYLIDHIL